MNIHQPLDRKPNSMVSESLSQKYGFYGSKHHGNHIIQHLFFFQAAACRACSANVNETRLLLLYLMSNNYFTTLSINVTLKYAWSSSPLAGRARKEAAEALSLHCIFKKNHKMLLGRLFCLDRTRDSESETGLTGCPFSTGSHCADREKCNLCYVVNV